MSDKSAREFEFTPADFARISKMIYARAGISLNPSKQDMVYSRLGRRLRALGFASFRDYLAVLDNPNADEWEMFTNALTTNLTSFFREEHHFPLLAAHLRRHRPGAGGTIEIWCNAASTGEEPYSIAMTAVEAFGGFNAPVHILATDIDTNVLQRAEHGLYPMDRLDKVSPERRKRFFLKGSGQHEGMAKVRRELRDMITYRQLNLLDDSWPIRGPFDAIFCRNVMIYFDKETQYRILGNFVPLLAADGLLFAGHSESFHHAANLFRLRGKTVYEPIHGR